jgi:hypothetical protein
MPINFKDLLHSVRVQMKRQQGQEKGLNTAINFYYSPTTAKEHHHDNKLTQKQKKQRDDANLKLMKCGGVAEVKVAPT